MLNEGQPSDRLHTGGLCCGLPGRLEAVWQLSDIAGLGPHAGVGDWPGLPSWWPFASIAPSLAPAGR